MKKTFDLSLELCTSGWNSYAAMALPGSRLYKEAVRKKLDYQTLTLDIHFMRMILCAFQQKSLKLGKF